MLSDQKIIEKLTNICEFFHKFKSEISLEIIDKSTKIINFIEYCNKYAIEISSQAIIDIMKYITVVEKYLKKEFPYAIK